MAQDASVPQDWERDLVRQAVESRFAEPHRDAVLAELASMRAEWFGATGTTRIDADELVRFVVRAQLEAVEQSAGDPAYFTEQRHRQWDDWRRMNRDRVYLLDVLIKYRQLAAKDVAALIQMLDVGTTRLDALSALENKGEGA